LFTESLAHAQRDGGVTQIKADRLMRELVGDPRYKAFLRKLKLSEWASKGSL
jgi:hypothetical protein